MMRSRPTRVPASGRVPWSVQVASWAKDRAMASRSPAVSAER